MTKFADLISNKSFVMGVVGVVIAGLSLWGLIYLASRANSKDNNSDNYDNKDYENDVFGAVLATVLLIISIIASYLNFRDFSKQIK
jgi:hypothetical protein